MLSYGFLLYGPGSYAWYQFLDRALPAKSLANLSAKVWSIIPSIIYTRFLSGEQCDVPIRFTYREKKNLGQLVHFSHQWMLIMKIKTFSFFIDTYKFDGNVRLKRDTLSHFEEKKYFYVSSWRT